MKVWLPSVRANSGGDVYVERLAELLKNVGCEVETTWFPLNRELTPWRLASVSPPEGTDVIHAVSWNAFAFRSNPQPLVVTVHHCVRHLGFPAWKGPLQAIYHNAWIGRFEAKSFACADAIVGVSESASEEVEKEFGVRGKIRVIENWLDTDTYSPLISPEAGPRRVLWVGNMTRRKGADLLAALRGCLDSTIELNIVAGRRAQTAGLERLGPGVKIWPRLSEAELIGLYRSCDVTISLSRHEGFGYTALEAMSCGRPVVAFDSTGIRDVVRHEETGILCPLEDVQSVADACRRLIEQPGLARCMGAAGRARALARFGPQRAGQAYTDLYEALVRAGRKQSS